MVTRRQVATWVKPVKGSKRVEQLDRKKPPEPGERSMAGDLGTFERVKEAGSDFFVGARQLVEDTERGCDGKHCCRLGLNPKKGECHKSRWAEGWSNNRIRSEGPGLRLPGGRFQAK